MTIQLIERLCEQLDECCYLGRELGTPYAYFDRDKAAKILVAGLLTSLVEDTEKLQSYLRVRESELDSEIASEALGGNKYKEDMARARRSELMAIKAVMTTITSQPNQKEQT